MAPLMLDNNQQEDNMNRMTQKEFRFSNGNFCPFCGSNETSNVSGSDETYYLQEHRICCDCKREWIEKHKLSGYKIVRKGKNKNRRDNE